MRLVESLFAGLRPSAKLDIPAWAEQHLVLTPKQATAYAGPYRVGLTPHLRGVFAALQDPAVHTVVLAKGAQAGATLAGYVWLCYAMAEDPGPILIVMPSADLASSASENRLQPMIEDSARMRLEKPSDPDRFKKLEYQMRGCSLNWVGSNSPGNLASRPVRYLMLDEVDKYPMDSGAEASAIALAMQRTKTFWNRKILAMSTPTIETGNIWRQYLRGDQRRYFVPCHACGAMQFLKWSQVKFDSTLPMDDAAAGAYYECESCQAHWTDLQKIEAVNRGEWRPTAKAKEYGVASFHVSSLYSPWTKWRGLVGSFLNAKDHPDLLHDFLNSELAEVWKPEVVTLKDDSLTERIAAYARGEMFATASCFADAYKSSRSMIVLGVDVQKDYLRYVARQFVAGGDSGMVDEGRLTGWQEVAALADSLGEKGGEVWVLVDSGYGERTQEVYEACLTHRFIPTKGSATPMRAMQWTQSTINVFEGSKRQAEGASVQLVTFDGTAFKLQLMDRIQGRSSFRWFTFSGIDDQYVREVTAEEYLPETGRFELRRGRKDNHAFDCEVLCLLGATIAGFNSRIFT